MSPGAEIPGHISDLLPYLPWIIIALIWLGSGIRSIIIQIILLRLVTWVLKRQQVPPALPSPGPVSAAPPEKPVPVPEPKPLTPIEKPPSQVAPDQTGRPDHIDGFLQFEGQQYRFGSGASAEHPSIPYGDYPITPSTIGPWGQAHGALGINDDQIWDAKLGRYRTGIELHPAQTTGIKTEGCIGVVADQWPQLRSAILARIASGVKLYLHVWPQIVSIDAYPSVTAVPTPGAPAPVKPTTVVVIDAGLMDAVKGLEGLNLHAYPDNKQYSIGYGTRATSPNETITKEEAEQRLAIELKAAEQSVESFAPNAPVGVKQALTSLTFNAGPSWQSAGLGDLIKAGKYEEAKTHFVAYNHADGAVNEGLTKRRNTEVKWFDNPI